MRSIPLPGQTVSLLATWKAVAPEGCPYVFMEQGRWDYYHRQVEAGKWRSGQELVNNLLRRFKTMCRKAGVGPYTIHDIRRSCITNWAKNLPIHVVKQLAGHSDIRTTQRFYLSVQPEDVRMAQAIQTSVLKKIPRSDLTDPKVTHSSQKRVFPGRQGVRRRKQVFKEQGLAEIRLRGLEPLTFGSVDRRSIQLSYRRLFFLSDHSITTSGSSCQVLKHPKRAK